MLLCTIFLYFCYRYFLLIYFTTLLLFRCVLLFSLLHMYKHCFFSSFLFTAFFGRTPEFFSPLFFLQALHYFSLNIIYKFAFNTHTLPLHWWHTYTHKIKSSFSPSLRLPNSTQKLRSCYAISARFKVHYTHTHGRRRRSSPFCLGFTPIAPPSRPLLGNFSSFCNPCDDDDELSVTSSVGGRRTLSLPFAPLFPLSSTFFTRGNLDRKYFITQHTWSKPYCTLLAKTTHKINKNLFKNSRKR